jgi:hypothetical protein
MLMHHLPGEQLCRLILPDGSASFVLLKPRFGGGGVELVEGLPWRIADHAPNAVGEPRQKNAIDKEVL